MFSCQVCRFVQHTTDVDLAPLDLISIHRGAAGLRSLGDRACGEAWAETARGPIGPAAVLRLLGRYTRLSQAQLIAAGADRPLPRLLKAVPR